MFAVGDIVLSTLNSELYVVLLAGDSIKIAACDNRYQISIVSPKILVKCEMPVGYSRYEAYMDYYCVPHLIRRCDAIYSREEISRHVAGTFKRVGKKSYKLVHMFSHDQTSQSEAVFFVDQYMRYVNPTEKCVVFKSFALENATCIVLDFELNFFKVFKGPRVVIANKLPVNCKFDKYESILSSLMTMVEKF